jgi:scyllo-inositol 2-dehydrogenase (NADP+)
MDLQNKKKPQVNVALCSFGMSGKLFHAPFIHVHPGFNLYACWERSKQLIGKTYPDVISYTSFDEIISDPQVDLVIVNTPNYTHYDLTKQALLAGKHVVVEKPFTITSEEATELVTLSREQGKLLSVYQNRRYDSDYRTIKKVLAEGLLGNIAEAEFHFDRFVEALSPKLHKETPGPGTGALYDLGSHLIDQALQLFGWPNAIFADITIIRPISQVDDYFELLLYYDRMRVRIRSTYVAREPIPGYVIHGSKGSFIKPKTNVQEIALLDGILPIGDDWGKEDDSERGLLHTVRNGEVVRELIPSLPGRYMDYFEAMYEAIVSGQPVPVAPMDAVKVIKIIEAAYKSSREKQVINL